MHHQTDGKPQEYSELNELLLDEPQPSCHVVALPKVAAVAANKPKITPIADYELSSSLNDSVESVDSSEG